MPATASTPRRPWPSAASSMRWSSNAWPSAPSRWRSCAAAASREHGYDPLLEARMRAVLPACVRQGVTIISNMGAANPDAAGAAVLAVARELGLPRLRVAVVTGDDVLPWVQAHDVALLDSTQRASDLGERLISANAYLGADALLPALASGRRRDHHRPGGRPGAVPGAADASPSAGAPTTGRSSARACSSATCWNARPRSAAATSPTRAISTCPICTTWAFRWPRCSPTARAVITKLAGSGGRVDRLTCTAQLLYEIEDPTRYLQPDVVADFSQVRLQELGPDRVQATGASGTARPQQLKATLGYRDGWIGEGQISYAGPGARERGALALQVLEHRLRGCGLEALEQRAELIGVDAMHGPHARRATANPTRCARGWRCAAATREQAERVGQEVEALYLNGPAGGGGVTQSVREVIAAASALVPRDAVRTAVPDPGTVMKLHDIAIARSGDKGNRATLSVIARDPAHYPLLERVLTAERVQAHYRGIVRGAVQRYPLPHLGACTS